MTSSEREDADTLVAGQACEQLFSDFHCHIDDGHATRAAELFNPNAVLEVRGERYDGIEAITGFLRAREAMRTRHTRHLGTDFRFRLDSPTTAHATARLLLFERNGGSDGTELHVEALVDCEMTFARLSGGEWRLSSRRHRRFATTTS
jgi:hypothetical protein